jgi:hypothetical protein
LAAVVASAFPFGSLAETPVRATVDEVLFVALERVRVTFASTPSPMTF